MAISLKSTVAAPVAAYPALKSSIVLFDCNPGTRSWTVPEGVSQIRAFVVGAGGGGAAAAGGGGGGYAERLISVTAGKVISYSVGAGGVNGSTGGTSSFGGVISATGGSASSGGTGSGGDINNAGGLGSTASGGGGGAAGHAHGPGQAGQSTGVGGGFSAGRVGRVDGWKIGIMPNDGQGGSYGCGTQLSTSSGSNLLRGWGGGGGSNNSDKSGGIGGGGSGGGGGTGGDGGPGLVGIEVIA